MASVLSNVKRLPSDHGNPQIFSPDLKVCEVACILRTDEAVVRSLIARGDLQAYRMNPTAARNNYRISPAALDAYRERHRVQPGDSRQPKTDV